MRTPSTIANAALAEVNAYATDYLRYNDETIGGPKKWGKDKYEDFTGQRAGRTFVAAIAFEDIDFSAIHWAFKLQSSLDPEYKAVIFEPYNDFIITIYDERE